MNQNNKNSGGQNRTELKVKMTASLPSTVGVCGGVVVVGGLGGNNCMWED